jgi:hypothetical protein
LAPARGHLGGVLLEHLRDIGHVPLGHLPRRLIRLPFEPLPAALNAFSAAPADRMPSPSTAVWTISTSSSSENRTGRPCGSAFWLSLIALLHGSDRCPAQPSSAQDAGVTAGTRGGLRTIAPMEPSGAEVGSAERSRRRGRARPSGRRRAVIVVAATLAGAAVIGVAGLSFARGSQWKERADERGARITDLEDELEATEAELQALEDRVGALTEEVSVAQDQLFIAELDVDQARELAALAGAVARDLASCVDGTSELVRIV